MVHDGRNTEKCTSKTGVSQFSSRNIVFKDNRLCDFTLLQLFNIVKIKPNENDMCFIHFNISQLICVKALFHRHLSTAMAVKLNFYLKYGSLVNEKAGQASMI